MTAQDLQVAGRRRATVSERDDVVEVAAPFGAAGAMGEAALPVAQADCASGRRIGTVRAAGRGDDLWAAVEEVTRQFGDEPRVHPGRQVSDDASRHDTETRHHDGTQGPRRAVVRPVVHHRTGSSAPRRWAPAFVRSASMPDATSGSRCCTSCTMARTPGMRASPCAAARATAGGGCVARRRHRTSRRPCRAASRAPQRGGRGRTRLARAGTTRQHVRSVRTQDDPEPAPCRDEHAR